MQSTGAGRDFDTGGETLPRDLESGHLTCPAHSDLLHPRGQTPQVDPGLAREQGDVPNDSSENVEDVTDGCGISRISDSELGTSWIWPKTERTRRIRRRSNGSGERIISVVGEDIDIYRVDIAGPAQPSCTTLVGCRLKATDCSVIWYPPHPSMVGNPD